MIFKILDLKYDIKIGRDTIKQYDLTVVCRSYFSVATLFNVSSYAHKAEIRGSSRSVSNKLSTEKIHK
jgi:hypothetical protein